MLLKIIWVANFFSDFSVKKKNAFILLSFFKTVYINMELEFASYFPSTHEIIFSNCHLVNFSWQNIIFSLILYVVCSLGFFKMFALFWSSVAVLQCLCFSLFYLSGLWQVMILSMILTPFFKYGEFLPIIL